MHGEISFRDTTPRDMTVFLDGAAIGTCSRSQWRGGTTMLYQWRATLADGYRVVDPDLQGTALDGLSSPTKGGIKAAVTRAVRAAPGPGAAVAAGAGR